MLLPLSEFTFAAQFIVLPLHNRQNKKPSPAGNGLIAFKNVFPLVSLRWNYPDQVQRV